MRVVLTHAYARSNSGDGLLVDEAAELIRDCFPQASIDLVAMAPESFPEFSHALNPIAGRRSRMTIFDLIRAGLTGRSHPDVIRLIEGADLVVAVGGAYLRATGCTSLAKAALSQMVQLPSRYGTVPHIYLPQSIGPFPVSPRLLTLRRLRHAAVVFARDDRSVESCSAMGVRAVRMPDLAVLAATRMKFPSPARVGSGVVGLVGRSLGNREKTYDTNFSTLVRRTNGSLLVQSRNRGNDDPAFYGRLGLQEDWPDLRSALDSESSRPVSVVSVRLHGSLQSILAGVPSIHLSYERKGWGAFEDLGISRFVHNARNFDVDLVLSQVEELRRDPSDYWERVQASMPRLAADKERLRLTLVDSVPLQVRT